MLNCNNIVLLRDVLHIGLIIDPRSAVHHVLADRQLQQTEDL